MHTTQLSEKDDQNINTVDLFFLERRIKMTYEIIEVHAHSSLPMTGDEGNVLKPSFLSAIILVSH